MKTNPSQSRSHLNSANPGSRPAPGWRQLLLWMMCIGAASVAQAQFNSGSSGANGAFPPVAVPDGTTEMVLDLRDGTLSFLPGGTTGVIPNTPAGGFADAIFNFTSVDIPTGVTLRFIRNSANTPVTILARQLVRINGTIDVSGEKGGNGGNNGNSGGGQGGPGGFKGGNGELLNSSPRAGTGLGPGGGIGGGEAAGSLNAGRAGGFATVTDGGVVYGQPSLLPLIGGSGGGGGPSPNNSGRVGGGGGGGGGAILIASTTIIEVNGAIAANGGGGGTQGGAGGSGGAIRLIAETIRGNGGLSAVGGPGVPTISGVSTGSNPGGLGRIRVEATFRQFSGMVGGFITTAGPGVVLLPNLPSVRTVSVAGVTVPAFPTGGFGGTDIVIAEPGPATIALAASNVPLGTTIAVSAKPEQDGLPIGPVTSTALAGAFANSSATAEIVFPAAGLYFIEARATFTVP